MTRYILGNLLTGRRIVDLNVITGPWSLRAGAVGTIQVKIDLNDPDMQALGLRNSATPAQSFLAVVEGDTIMEAGPVWTRNYSRSDGTLDLGASGIGSLFAHRLILPLLAKTLNTDQWTVPDPADSTKTIANPLLSSTYTGLSLATIAKRLVQQARTWTGGTVPIVFQTDEADDATRTYLGTDFKPVWEALQDLSNVENGPEIAFVPRFTADSLGVEWVLRTGTVAQPLITSPSVLEWDVTAPESPVSEFSIDEDASQVASLAWLTGGRGVADVLVARSYDATLVNASFPLLESLDSSHTDVSVQSTLDAYARQDVAVGRYPLSTTSMTVKANPIDQDGNPAGPQVGSYAVGDYASIHIEKFPRKPDGSLDTSMGIGDLWFPEGGDFVQRINGMSGDEKGVDIKLSFAQKVGG